MGKEEHKETRTLLLDIEGVVWGWHGIGSLQGARLPLIRHGCSGQLGGLDR